MKTIEQLQLFFENEIKPNLSELEMWRKKIWRRSVIKYYIFFGSLIAFPIVYFLIRHFKYSINVNEILKEMLTGLAWAVIVFGPVLFFIYRSLWKSIKNPRKKKPKNIQFKNIVIGKIVEFISPELNYSPKKKTVLGKEFLESEIFPHWIFYPLGYYAEDFVEGKIGKTNIRFYEINGKKTYFHTKNENPLDGTVEKIDFFGMFFIADFNKLFNGHTLVLPKNEASRSQWITASGRELIKMDDPEFEKLFTVYGTDQITSRYVLSNSLMQRIVKSYNKIGKEISISFTNNKLYVAINHKKNKFELELNKSVYNFERIKEFYYDLKTAIDIVENLNLKTRIWLKDDQENSILFKNPDKHNYRKRKLYKFLAYAFGYLGAHLFYAGYRRKGSSTLLTSIIVFTTLISFAIATKLDGAKIVLVAFSIFWFWFVTVKATWITHDSKGYPMK